MTRTGEWVMAIVFLPLVAFIGMINALVVRRVLGQRQLQLAWLPVSPRHSLVSPASLAGWQLLAWRSIRRGKMSYWLSQIAFEDSDEARRRSSSSTRI